MNKIHLFDGHWFDTDTAKIYPSPKRLENNIIISKATNKDEKEEDEYLLYTSNRNWIKCHKKGNNLTYKYITKKEAAIWFSSFSEYLIEDLPLCVGYILTYELAL